jgi:hypothetical protein
MSKTLKFTLALAAIFTAAALSAGSIITVDVPGALETRLLGISNNGVAVGYYEDSSFNQHGFARLANGTLIYPFDDPAGAPNPVFSTLFFGVNNGGTIVGRDDNFPVSLFILSGGIYNTYSIPGCVGGSGSSSISINDSGDVAGSCGALGSAYLQTTGNTPVVFNLPGALLTTASGLNNLDQVVGQYITPSGTVRGYGFVRNTDGTYTLISVPGAYIAGLSGINDAGVFVGTWEDFSLNLYAFYGTPGNLTPFSIPGDTRIDLSGINNSDEVVGSYQDSSNGVHGFITTFATPEPSSVLLGMLGLLGLAALKSGRKLG